MLFLKLRCNTSCQKETFAVLLTYLFFSNNMHCWNRKDTLNYPVTLSMWKFSYHSIPPSDEIDAALNVNGSAGNCSALRGRALLCSLHQWGWVVLGGFEGRETKVICLACNLDPAKYDAGQPPIHAVFLVAEERSIPMCSLSTHIGTHNFYFGAWGSNYLHWFLPVRHQLNVWRGIVCACLSYRSIQVTHSTHLFRFPTAFCI
jgi:hypothetical protein